MEKIHDDQDLHLKLFENKINSNLFKFLIREYFSNSMNPFLILKLLSKILFSNISKLLKLKYILFFLTILKRLTINERILKEHINPIITDTFEHILTRKADFVIILQYAIFLVQIGQIDFALSRLQIFSTDLRFINNGELVFYRGLIDYIDYVSSNNSKSNKSYMSLFHKSLTLLKKNEKDYGEFIIDFLGSKSMLNEVAEFLKHDKIKEIFEKTDKKKFKILNILADSEFMELSRKISILSEELNRNFTNFTFLFKFCDLVENYYEEKNLYSNCDVDMINANDYHQEFNYEDNVSFSMKIAFVNYKYLKVYLEFLSTYVLFDPYNKDCLHKLEDLLNYLKNIFKENNITHETHKNYYSSMNQISNNQTDRGTADKVKSDLSCSNKNLLHDLFSLVKEYNTTFIEILLKQILLKEITKLYKEYVYYTKKISVSIFIEDKNSQNTFQIEEKIKKFLNNFYCILNMLDLINEIAYGYPLNRIYSNLFLPYQSNFNMNNTEFVYWCRMIKNINIKYF